MITPNASGALPVVTTLAECANFDKSFGQFLPQLYALPNEVYGSISDPQALKQLYINTNPAISGLAVAIALCPLFFIISEINKNYSQVDRVWSILPTLFNIHYATWVRFSGLPTSRVDNVLAFSILWSCRLTFNYWRRGGYQIGSEDYRWEIIGKYIGKFGLFVLNIFFISSVQLVSWSNILDHQAERVAYDGQILLWSVTLPTYLLVLTSRIKPELAAADMIIGRLMMGLVVFEYFADQQQWNFQGAKKKYQETAKLPNGWTRPQMDRGFVTTGLWRYSRHPNFAAEQSIWLLLYFWAAVETEKYWNWTVAGAISYCLIFQGSTPLTEWISSSKYPEYMLYQERVGMFVPKLFGKGWDEKEIEKLGPQFSEQMKKKEGKKKS